MKTGKWLRSVSCNIAITTYIMLKTFTLLPAYSHITMVETSGGWQLQFFNHPKNDSPAHVWTLPFDGDTEIMIKRSCESCGSCGEQLLMSCRRHGTRPINVAELLQLIEYGRLEGNWDGLPDAINWYNIECETVDTDNNLTVIVYSQWGERVIKTHEFDWLSSYR